MALAHSTLSHEPSAPASKADSHASSKHHYVPIRPAFRPLLPKPCTRESSPSTGIHIHTRTTLSAGRKRVSTSKADLQKRRKAYPQVPMPNTKSKTEFSSQSSPSSTMRGGGLSGAPSHPIYEKNLLQSRVAAKTADIGTPQEAVGLQGISPVDVTYQNMDISAFAESSIASPQSALLAEKISSSVSSISSLEEAAAPSTPMSIGESPTSISTASMFFPMEDHKVAGTINPINITTAIEGEDFLEDAEQLSSLGPLGQFRDSILTPPESQKPLSAAMPFNSFGQGGTDYDEFSDLYYRADSLASMSDHLLTNNKNSGNIGFAEEAPSVLPGNAASEQQDFAEKDEDYSILEYFAPSADLF